MSTKINDIQQAINTFDIELARHLLRDGLQDNPGADIYYLASQVALDSNQRRHFLNQALELDPFHQDAYNALESLNQASATAHTQPQSNPLNTYIQSNSKYWNEHQLAASSKRFIAMLIDLGILLFMGTIMNWVITLLVPPPLRSNYETIQAYIHAIDMWHLFVYIIGVILNATYYTVTLTYMKGQTIGKKAMNIRVIKKNGKPITELDAFLRNVVGYFVSTIVLFVGFIWTLFDTEKQGWHDKIAGTVVVEDK